MTEPKRVKSRMNPAMIKDQTIYNRSQKDSSNVAMDPSEDTKIFQSTDYGRFIFSAENRPIYQAHINKIKLSLKENGFLKERPIDVIRQGEQLSIIDGQHRFIACRDLEIPIYYSVKDDSSVNISRSIRVINTYLRPWKEEDFLHHFIVLGYPSYVLLKKFMNENDLGISAAIGILLSGNLSNDKDLKHSYRIGALVFDSEAVEKAIKVIRPINDIRNLHERLMPLRRDPAFIKSLIILTSCQRYDHERMLKNLSHNLVSCVYCTSVGKYLQVLEGIYNYKRQEGTRIHLSRKGMTLVNREVDEEAKSTIL